jgi:hypothetical protein
MAAVGLAMRGPNMGCRISMACALFAGEIGEAVIFVKKCKIGQPFGDFEIMEKKSD